MGLAGVWGLGFKVSEGRSLKKESEGVQGKGGFGVERGIEGGFEGPPSINPKS